MYNKELEGTGACEFDASLVGLHSKSGLHVRPAKRRRKRKKKGGRRKKEGGREEEEKKEENEQPGGGVGCSCFLQRVFPKREVTCQCSVTVSTLASSHSPSSLSFCAWVIQGLKTQTRKVFCTPSTSKYLWTLLCEFFFLSIQMKTYKAQEGCALGKMAELVGAAHQWIRL